MNRRVIGSVSVEWDMTTLVVTRTLASLAPRILLSCCQWIVFPSLIVHSFALGGWNMAILICVVGLIPTLFFLFTLLRRRVLIFDRFANLAIGSRASEKVALDTLTAIEVLTLEKGYAIVLRQQGGFLAMFAEMTMALRFKQEEQAREFADILNVFLRQLEATETPGVWPPPPRRVTNEGKP